MIRGPKKTVSLLIPQDTYDKVKCLAEANRRTVSSYLRVMIYNYLRRLEEKPPEKDDWWLVR